MKFSHYGLVGWFTPEARTEKYKYRYVLESVQAVGNYFADNLQWSITFRSIF